MDLNIFHSSNDGCLISSSFRIIQFMFYASKSSSVAQQIVSISTWVDLHRIMRLRTIGWVYIIMVILSQICQK